MTVQGGELLQLADRLPLGELPGIFRAPMRLYLSLGVLPDRALRSLLEGDFPSALHFTGVEALEVCVAARWIEAHLPAYAHGNRDQVQLFIVYVRRARGRELLASMEGAPRCPCPLRSVTDPSRTMGLRESSSPPSSSASGR